MGRVCRNALVPWSLSNDFVLSGYGHGTQNAGTEIETSVGEFAQSGLAKAYFALPRKSIK